MSVKNTSPSIAAAAVLSFLPVPLALLRVALADGMPSGVGRVIAWLLAAAFFGWISLSLYRGKKWSWWWVVISTTVGTILMFSNPQFPAWGIQLLIYWLQTVSIWLASAILFLPKNRKWFAA